MKGNRSLLDVSKTDCLGTATLCLGEGAKSFCFENLKVQKANEFIGSFMKIYVSLQISVGSVYGISKSL